MEQCYKSALVVIIEQLYNDKTKLKDVATLELTKCAALGWVGPGLGPGFLGWCSKCAIEVCGVRGKMHGQESRVWSS